MKKLLGYRWESFGMNVEAFNLAGDNFLLHQGWGRTPGASMDEATPCSEYFNITPTEARAVAYAVGRLPDLLSAIESDDSELSKRIVEDIRGMFR
jgi:hypothetical protein